MPWLVLYHPEAIVELNALPGELRPRGGRSRWRAFYSGVGAAFVVGSIGPEAGVNRRGFNRAVAAAEERIKEVEEE
ncbi:hypothetical protein AB0J68_02245 [Micromonospora sp. NPDC049580]|uniref:hypothetical protein n=1 Tax=unclassified Micromonospora TaxID=2617518 RepID=UPI0033BC41A2